MKPLHKFYADAEYEDSFRPKYFKMQVYERKYNPRLKQANIWENLTMNPFFTVA